MKNKYPDHKITKDIGSELNMKRTELKKIINLAIKGETDQLIITYKDRLARFGYELIEYIIEEYSKGKIIIENPKENINPENEIVDDILQIMDIYVVKINGLRRWNKRLEKVDKY